MGNNGPHSISAQEQVKFQKFEDQEWQTAWPCGPSAKSTNLRNVHIRNATASNGTIDYFKWDPDGPDALKQPHITFDIVDCDPHKYRWVVYYRQSAGSETWSGNDYWYVWGIEDSGGATSIAVDAPLATAEGQHLDADVHPWGTYTYEILVMEYTGDTAPNDPNNALDHNYLKTPYCLWVPESTPETPPRSGHEVNLFVPEQGPAELRVKYWLNDPHPRDAHELNLVAIDPALAEKASVSGPREQGQWHAGTDEDNDGEPDGIKVYTFQDDDPAGAWRVLWTGADECGVYTPYRRIHEHQRMLVANGTDRRLTAANYGSNLAGSTHDRVALGAAREAQSISQIGRAPGVSDGTAKYGVTARHGLDLVDLFFFWGHSRPPGGVGIAVKTMSQGLPWYLFDSWLTTTTDVRDTLGGHESAAVEDLPAGYGQGRYANCGFAFLMACDTYVGETASVESSRRWVGSATSWGRTVSCRRICL